MNTVATLLRTKWEELLPTPFFLFVLGWFVGGLWYFYSFTEPDVRFWIVAALFAVFFVVINFKKQKDTFLKTSILVFGICFGGGYSQYYTNDIHDKLIRLDNRDQIWKVEGLVHEIEPISPKRNRILLGQLILEGKPVPDSFLRITTSHALQLGDRVDLLAKLFSPSPAVVPNGFDFQQRAFFDRIIGVGYTLSEPWIIQKNSHFTSVWTKIRHKVNQAIEQDFSSSIAPLVRTLLLGDRQSLSDHQWSVFRSSGLSHLLAISGMHIGMVAFAVYAFIRAFAALVPRMVLFLPIHRFAAVIAVFFAAGYVGLAGESVSINRAFMMVSVIMIGILLETDTLRFRSMTIAALVIMLWKPEVVTSASFQLSFGAVWVLIAYFQSPKRLGYYFPKPIGSAIDIGISSLWITVILIPLVWWHFGQIYPWGAVSNIIAIPWMAFTVMPLIFFYFFSIFLGVSDFTATMLEPCLVYLFDFAKLISDLPISTLILPPLQLPWMLLLMGCGFLLILRYRHWNFRTCGIFSLCVGFITSFALQDSRVNIIINQDTKSIAFADKTKMYLMGNDPSNFISRQWQNYWQVSTLEQNPQYGEINTQPWHCEDKFCVFGHSSQRLIVRLDESIDCEISAKQISLHRFDSCGFTAKEVSFLKRSLIFISLHEDGVVKINSSSGSRPWQNVNSFQ